MFDRSNGSGGMYAWQFPVNFLILRIVSYSIDYHHACRYYAQQSHSSLPLNSSTKHSAHQSMKMKDDKEDQQEQKDDFMESSPDFHRPLEEYTNIIYFLSYILYVPLYMAGPIISYNSFIYYAHYPNTSPENILLYGLRWVGCFLVMEYLSHRFPFFAVIQAGLFPYLDINEIIVVAYMTLQLMWLKFLLIWRFFRLWALADGCNPPENMLKCMSNNCSLEEFWRSWHASFNQFLIK